jgi:hypothetical protein
MGSRTVVGSYTHELPEADASWRGKVALGEADAKPGRYYVTVWDGRRAGYLLGPFVQHGWGKEGHARALGLVADARRYVQAHHTDSHWWSFGTVRVPLFGPAPAGKLNDLIGPFARPAPGA